MKSSLALSAILGSMIVVGCSSPSTPMLDRRSSESERFSLAIVQSSIKKGVSTKGEVLSLLGVPNLISKDRDGREIHIWDKRSVESERSSGLTSSVSAQSERSITISITYTARDLVSDVSYRATSF